DPQEAARLCLLREHPPMQGIVERIAPSFFGLHSNGRDSRSPAWWSAEPESCRGHGHCDRSRLQFVLSERHSFPHGLAERSQSCGVQQPEGVQIRSDCSCAEAIRLRSYSEKGKSCGAYC